jgi:hypothetical protein
LCRLVVVSGVVSIDLEQASFIEPIKFEVWLMHLITVLIAFRKFLEETVTPPPRVVLSGITNG